METDGWYIDFAFGLNCERNAAPMMVGRRLAVAVATE